MKKETVIQFGLCIGLLPILVLPVWMAAGVYRAWQWPLIPLTLWAWFWFWIVPGNGPFPDRKHRLYLLIRSPVFWFSVLFIGYLLCQSWNSGRIRTFDFEQNIWMYSPPPHPTLPSAFVGEESFEMVKWFLPALSVWLIVRLIPVSTVGTLCKWVLAFAVLNGLLALWHFIAGWHTMYNLGRSVGKFPYGTFGYPNHGAAFFVLMLGLSMGFALGMRRGGRKHWNILKRVIWISVIFLLALAALGSLSRFAIAGVVLLGAFFSGWLVLRLMILKNWKGLLLFGGCALTVVGVMALIWIRDETVREQVTDLWIRILDGRGDEAISERLIPFQVRAAFRLWCDYPILGTGGWGLRYLIGFYLPAELWRDLPYAYANLHHDPLQFLVEFGLVGFGLLLGVFAGAVWTCIRDLFSRPSSGRCLWTDPLRLYCWVALILVCAQSLIDFPFRSPAILINAVLLLHVASTRSDGAPPSA